MIKDNYIDISKIVTDKKVFKLFHAVESHGGVLRFVGGAVRDTLAGIKNFDIDLATDLSPEEMVEACEEKGLKTVPIGIKFGTIGVVINNTVLEVTSLRKDIKTDGRHAEVEFTSDWESDASRRDLTINAIYADEKGTVFDYYNGIHDLENGIVRFIGNAGQRIKEDYLRILRFFRFYSIFGKKEIDAKALKACIENKEGLKGISVERICSELKKIILTPNAAKTLRIMSDNEILAYVLPQSQNIDKLQFLINLVDKHDIAHNALRRLFVLYNPDEKLAENLAFRLKMSRKERELFVSLAQHQPDMEEFSNQDGLRRLLYLYGRDFCYNRFLISAALCQIEPEDFTKTLAEIESLDIPVFMLKGKDIIDAGIINRHRISGILNQLEDIWAESNFTLCREELVELAQKIVAETDKAG